MNIYKPTLAALSIAAVTLGMSGAALAKGGTTTAGVPTISGPCTFEWIIEAGHDRYPLTHNEYPGNVWVDMTLSANSAPKADLVCLDPGWTVESKSATGGVQMTFKYQGVKAIDFKFVLGKTDIRNY